MIFDNAKDREFSEQYDIYSVYFLLVSMDIWATHSIIVYFKYVLNTVGPRIGPRFTGTPIYRED